MIDYLIITILILVNGALSMAEMAVVSSRKARLAGRMSKGDSAARLLIKTLEEPTSFLSTIQIGITLIGIITGAYGGTTFGDQLAPVFASVPFITPFAEEIAFLLVVTVITLFSLLFGELVPKRIAIRNPEGIALIVIHPLHLLEKVFSPIVWLLSASTRIVLFFAGQPPVTDDEVIEEEISQMAAEAERSGSIDDLEALIVRQAFLMNDLIVRDIMIPRHELVWLDSNDDLSQLTNRIRETRFTHYPVADGSIDQVQGILNTRDLWICQQDTGRPDLLDALTPPLFIPETLTLVRLMDLFKAEKKYYGLVVDEYGAVQGWVTSAEIMSLLVGEQIEPERQRHFNLTEQPDGSWLVSGQIPFYELEEQLDHTFEEQEDPATYSTLAGFILSHLNTIPKTGETLQTEGFTFTITQMNGNRIDQVKISKPTNQ